LQLFDKSAGIGIDGDGVTMRGGAFRSRFQGFAGRFAPTRRSKALE
jgi:hypothetical protein